MEDYQQSFIEVQFPVSKVSKESFKERSAKQGQTLTGIGRWWGRKPLILVRAALLGLLMPSSDNPVRDREVFLKILTMDDAGLLLRKIRSIPATVVFGHVPTAIRSKYFKNDGNGKAEYRNGISKEEKQYIQTVAFKSMSYDIKIRYCCRPEEITLSDVAEWSTINDHLGTKALNIQDLIQELGTNRYNRIPIVGDVFCGGGSVPFEAARIGCAVYASELNPIAMLLTWASLNVNGATQDSVNQIEKFRQEIYRLVDKQITGWGIEHNEVAWRAKAYLYCNETLCPKCGKKAKQIIRHLKTTHVTPFPFGTRP